MDRERRTTADDAPDQTWGQGEGAHEPTIPEDDAESSTTLMPTEGGSDTGEPESLAPDEEGMDR